MQRRNFLRTAALAVGATTALAGCSSGPSTPPRESSVFESLAWTSGALAIDLASTPVVQSRADISGSSVSLLPVGVAAAGGRGGRGGRGGSSRGRGSGTSAARTGRHGRKKWRSTDADDDWYEEHDDEIDEYRCAVRTCAVGYLGSDDAYEEDPPGPGPVNWDQEWTDPGSDALQYSMSRPGWYRVGSHLVHPNTDHDFGWEAVDFELVPTVDGGFEVDNQWKISPLL